MKFKSKKENPVVFMYRGMRSPARLNTGEVSHEVPVTVYFTPEFQKDIKLGRIEPILTAIDRQFIGAETAKAAKVADHQIANTPSYLEKPKPVEVTEDSSKAKRVNAMEEELRAEMAMIKSDKEKLDFLLGAKARLSGHRYSEDVVNGLIKELGPVEIEGGTSENEKPSSDETLDAKAKAEVKATEIDEALSSDEEKEPKVKAPTKPAEKPGVGKKKSIKTTNNKSGSEKKEAGDDLIETAKKLKGRVKKRSPKAKMMAACMSLGVKNADPSMKQAELYAMIKDRIKEILN